jgi:hypothetical protein
MPTDVTCPKCQAQQRVPDQALGKPAECPLCGAQFTVPGKKKLCSRCAKDLSHAARSKDQFGNYYCPECLKKVKAAPRTTPAAGAPTVPPPHPPSQKEPAAPEPAPSGRKTAKRATEPQAVPPVPVPSPRQPTLQSTAETPPVLPAVAVAPPTSPALPTAVPLPESLPSAPEPLPEAADELALQAETEAAPAPAAQPDKPVAPPFEASETTFAFSDVKLAARVTFTRGGETIAARVQPDNGESAQETAFAPAKLGTWAGLRLGTTGRLDLTDTDGKKWAFALPSDARGPLKTWLIRAAAASAPAPAAPPPEPEAPPGPAPEPEAELAPEPEPDEPAAAAASAPKPVPPSGDQALDMARTLLPGEDVRVAGAAYWDAPSGVTAVLGAKLAIGSFLKRKSAEPEKKQHRAGILAVAGGKLIILDLCNIAGEEFTLETLQPSSQPKPVSHLLRTLSAGYNETPAGTVLHLHGELSLAATFPPSCGDENRKKAVEIARAVTKR